MPPVAKKRSHRFGPCLINAAAILCLTACGRLGYEEVASECAVAVCGADANPFVVDALGFGDSAGGPGGNGPAPDAAMPLADTAAPQDAGARDAVTDARTVSYIALPYLQDFESPAATWSSRVAVHGSEPVRDPSRKYRGEASLNYNRSAMTGGGYLEVSLPAVVVTGQLYMRVHVYVPATLVVANWVIPMEMKGTSQHDGKFSLDLGQNNDFATNLTGVGTVSAPGEKFPRDRWVCAELGVNLSASAGWIRLYVDRKLVVSRENINTLLSEKFPGVQRFRAGLLAAPEQGASALWIDDWAVSSSYIGCD